MVILNCVIGPEAGTITTPNVWILCVTSLRERLLTRRLAARRNVTMSRRIRLLWQYTTQYAKRPRNVDTFAVHELARYCL